nr:uncharacterized protein LOC113811914 [Penaeus vannamei]
MKYTLILVLAVAGVLAQEYQKCDQSISDQCPAEDGEFPVFFPDPELCRLCECSVAAAPGTSCVGLALSGTPRPTNVTGVTRSTARAAPSLTLRPCHRPQRNQSSDSDEMLSLFG